MVSYEIIQTENSGPAAAETFFSATSASNPYLIYLRRYLF
jgi:hypothetical protein